MADVYEILKPKKGAAYKEDQIESYSLLNTPISSGKVLCGKSRIYGDVDDQTYKKIIDIIISLCSRFDLTYKETAYTLLICLAESGFNPDAAAGTTSASGLAQYTVDTAKAFKNRAKSVLGLEIDMSGLNVFDTTIGSYGVLVAFLFNRNLAIEWDFKDSDDKYWQLIYMLHHDGPGYYTDDRGKERAKKFKWRSAAIETYERVFKKNLVSLTSALQEQKTETKLKLTDVNGNPIEGKNYVVAAPKNTNGNKPSHLSMNGGYLDAMTILFGKTDAEGESKSIMSKIGDEVITILLPDNFRDLIKTNSSDSYTVRKGDTLESIAKRNGTTADKIAKNNQLKNKNIIKVGQKLHIENTNNEIYIVKKGDTLVDIAKKYGTTTDEIARLNNLKNKNIISINQKLKIPKYLRHKPANSALLNIFGEIGIENFNLNILTFFKNHTAKPKGSTSNNLSNSKNTIELRTPVAKDAVKAKKQKNSTVDENKTKSNGNTKKIELDFSDGMAIIYTFQDMDYGPYEEPKKGYTVFYDHLGNKIFSFKSGSRADSSSKENADGAFSGFYVRTDGGKRDSRLGKAYGTTKIITNDARARWVHGGGGYTKNSEEPAYRENQPWRVTMGCTRAQNIDLENLAKKIQDFQKKYPKIKIKYIRDKKGSYPK